MASLGYDADFFGIPVAPPTTPGGVSDPEPDAEPDAELEYVHFTVRMHPTRRLAWWVAWNIDGLRLFPGDSISRAGERFRADPRIPESAQTLEEAYVGNDLDRGHVARRSDLLWGTLPEALQANSDSFFFPNIIPQLQNFNQSGRGGPWGLLENAVLAQEGLEERRLTLFAGPVLAATDPPYRGIVQLPREHWKTVVYRIDGQLRFKCFVLSQDLDEVSRTYLDEFDTYLVSLDFLEERTGLTFPSLREHVVPEADRQRSPVMVSDVDQVDW
ncbi:DNA/RNA non-specific endonuclease [Nocardioides campestrisoli]|uniref:DNA/RNA non-specific endonuclease n=1 Tax=Nocardioides campestrisoli TaxID=2736757 RepID=UPI0015E7A2FD|nr:DNA/RNA non-specific endonuclease [Nocardioides campestrisoli]